VTPGTGGVDRMGKDEWAGLPGRLAAGFGAPAAGASPGVPLRSADISLTLPRRGRDAATLNSVKRFLLAQQAPFRPADVTTVRLASGQAVLHVEFTGPSPLGLLGALN
jgi:hypothetical protein